MVVLMGLLRIGNWAATHAYEPTWRLRIARIHQLGSLCAWSELTTRARHTRRCSKANAPAAVREETPSFPKMFCTWRCDRVLADHERGGDLAVALAGRDQPQHLELAIGQAVPLGPRIAQVCEVRPGAQLLERLARRFELELGRVLVPERAAGLSDECPHARALVRRFELAPGPLRLAEGGQGRLRIAAREGDCSARVGRRGGKCALLVPGGDRIELGARALGLVEIAGREHDLDERGQKGRARGRLGALSRALRIAAAAASSLPCASRRSASPGWGSRPFAFALR